MIRSYLLRLLLVLAIVKIISGRCFELEYIAMPLSVFLVRTRDVIPRTGVFGIARYKFVE